MSTENQLPLHLPSPFSTDPVDRVIRYHVQTKHHFNRYARALGYLDWANQPDPFRRFEGAPLVLLPLLPPDEDPVSSSYDAIYQPGAVACQPLNVRSLSRFFEFALALSAWKKAGESEWALRSNPSSGNLHPTEGYLVLPQFDGLNLKPGLYHYAPKEHGLELRAEFPLNRIARLLTPFLPGAFSLRAHLRSLAGGPGSMASGRFVTATTMPVMRLGQRELRLRHSDGRWCCLMESRKTPSPRSWVRLAKKISTMLSVSIRTA